MKVINSCSYVAMYIHHYNLFIRFINLLSFNNNQQGKTKMFQNINTL